MVLKEDYQDHIGSYFTSGMCVNTCEYTYMHADVAKYCAVYKVNGCHGSHLYLKFYLHIIKG